MKNKTFPILLAFLCMGFGDAVGPFVGLAKEHFQLTFFEAQLIAFMGFIMFGILSVPMGVFQDRTGKKFILLLGLIIALVGLAIPMFGLSKFYLFLAAFCCSAQEPAFYRWPATRSCATSLRPKTIHAT